MLTPYTQNRYAYVGNNPVNRWDPLGYWQAGDETLSTQAQAAIWGLTELWYKEEDYDERLNLNEQANRIRQLDRSRTYFNTEEPAGTWSKDNTQYADPRKGSTGWYTDWIKTVNEYKKYNIYSNAKNDYTGEIVSKTLIGDRTDTTTTTINGTDFKPFTEKEWFAENKHWLDSYGGPPITYRPAKGYSKAGRVTANNVKGRANMCKLDIISSKEPANTNYKKTELSKVKDKTGLPLKSVVNSETYNYVRYLAYNGKASSNKAAGNSYNIDLSKLKPEDVSREIAEWLIANPVNVFATQHPYITQALTGVNI